jgi:hypothetical protein
MNKLFTSPVRIDLELKVNEWLEDNQGIKILDEFNYFETNGNYAVVFLIESIAQVQN